MGVTEQILGTVFGDLGISCGLEEMVHDAVDGW